MLTLSTQDVIILAGEVITLVGILAGLFASHKLHGYRLDLIERRLPENLEYRLTEVERKVEIHTPLPRLSPCPA